jgi:hypothetical protein
VLYYVRDTCACFAQQINTNVDQIAPLPAQPCETPLQGAILRCRTNNNKQVQILDFLYALTSPELAFVSVNDFLDYAVPLLPPEEVIHSDFLSSSTILKCLRDLLNARGCNIPVTRQQNMTSGIIDCLYSYESAVLSDATERFIAYRQSDSNTRASYAGPQVSGMTGFQNVQYNSSNKEAMYRAHRMSTRWKDSHKFSGGIGSVPGFHQFKQHYQDAICDYTIPPSERVRFFHHDLKDTAYTFFQENISGKARDILEAYSILEAQFCSAASQHSTKTLLESLNIRRVMSRKNVDVAVALAHCFSGISRLSSQCPSDFRSDSHRSRFLLHAVRDETWARSTLESNLAAPLSFVALHTRLASSVILHIELDERVGGLRSQLSGRDTNVLRRTVWQCASYSRPKISIRTSHSWWSLWSIFCY